MKYKLRDIAYDYWDFIQQILIFESSSYYDGYNRSKFSYYGLDKRRTELHDLLCKACNLSKEDTRELTDNIDQFKSFDEFYHTLQNIKKKKNKNDIYTN